MRTELYQRLILWATLLTLASSCGKFIGNLRRDLDDSDPARGADDRPSGPTVGGNWAERGYMGHADRSPASAGPVSGGWNSPNDMERNRRDQARDMRNAPGDPYLPSTATVATLEPETKRMYKNGSRATKDDFIDQSQEEGSLWASSGQTNYYFTKNKIRSPGDLITLNIENDLYRDIGVEIKRTLSPKEKAKEVAIVQEKNRAKVMAELNTNRKDTLTTSAAAPQGVPSGAPNANPSANPGETSAPSAASVPAVVPTPAPLSAEEIDRLVPRASMDDVDIYPSLEFKAGDTMMGEIIERYPNGNYKIRTVKRIPYKLGPPRLVTVVGIVKHSDINEETDVVNSNKLYEYRVDVAH